MPIPEFITARKSIRVFSHKKLPNGMVELLVEAACHAPSAGNLQPWEFVIVQSDENKSRLVEAAGGQSFIADAPVIFVVCAVPSRSRPRYKNRGVELYCIQDTAAAVQNILLTATANGLGSCWIGAFDEAKVAEVIGAPEGIRPVALVPAGFPAESPTRRPRRPLTEIIHRERF